MAEEKLKRKIQRSNIVLMIVSLAIAIFLWLFLSLTAFPEIKVILRDIPIDFSLEDTYAAVRGLSVIQSDIETVNVSVNGFRYQIGNYTSADIHVGLNLETIRDSGSYTVPLVATSVHGDPLSNIVIEPEAVHIEVDRFGTKTLSVENGALGINLNNIRAASGYVIDPEEVEISPSEITISGPQDYIDQVDSCMLSFDVAMSLNETKTLTPNKIQFYSSGAPFESSRVSYDTDEFSVYVPVYITKQIPLDVTVTGYNGVDCSDVPYTMSVDSILVRGHEELEGIDSINLGYIDIRDVVPGAVFDFTIAPSSHYTNISGIDQVTVRFDLEGYTTKRITLVNSQIHTVGGSALYEVTVEQDRLGVTIVGPAELLDTVDSSNFIAEINLNDYGYSETGSRMLTASVYSPRYPNKIWSYGTTQVLASYAMTQPPINQQNE